jgi:hypothetical protein
LICFIIRAKLRLSRDFEKYFFAVLPDIGAFCGTRVSGGAPLRKADARSYARASFAVCAKEYFIA